MNQKQFVQFIKDFYDKNLKIVEAKNRDYSGEDTFKAFKLTEAMGNTTVEEGLLVRMSDKLSRISTLLKTKQHVKDETIEDTLADLANYSAILAAYMSQKLRNDWEKGYSEGIKPDMLTREDFNVRGALDKTSKVINDAPQYLQFKGTETSTNQIERFIAESLEFGNVFYMNFSEQERALAIEFNDTYLKLVAGSFIRIDRANKNEPITVVTEEEYNKLINQNG